MDFKITLFFILTSTNYIFSQILNCSDAPQKACGLNANCFDDPSDINYKILNGPYCKCSDNSYGSPPNCKLRCSYDSDCKSNEFCDFTGSKECIDGCRFNSCKTGEFCDFSVRKCQVGCKMDLNCAFYEFCDKKLQKCEKVCSKNSCGLNGKCMAKYHIKYCSCVDGFVADNTVKGCRPQNNSEEKSSCDISCDSQSKCTEFDNLTYCYCPSTPESNPFETCPPGFSHFPGQPQPFKPTTENQVFSLQTVMILTG